MNSQDPALGLDAENTPAEGAEFAKKIDEEEAPILPSPVNYDDEGLTEVNLGEIEYRFDAGKQGTALCLSERPSGTYAWRFLGEVRWDGRDLRSRSLQRALLVDLSQALRKFMAETAN